MQRRFKVRIVKHRRLAEIEAATSAYIVLAVPTVVEVIVLVDVFLLAGIAENVPAKASGNCVGVVELYLHLVLLWAFWA